VIHPESPSAGNRRRQLYGLVLIGALAGLWWGAWFVGAGHISVTEALSALQRFGTRKSTPAILLVCYVVGSLCTLPGTVMLATAVACLGSWRGLWLCLNGTTISAGIVWILSSHLGRDYLARYFQRELNTTERLLTARPFLRVLQMRLVVLIPFHIVSILSGVSRVNFRRFLVATALGVAPRMMVEVYFFHHLLLGYSGPRSTLLVSAAVSLALLVLVTAAGMLLDRMLKD
jgi:phospholipase D1/2